MLINIKNAYKAFGSQDIFEDLEFSVKRNEKIALIGANGVGKTTLFRVIQRDEFLDKGELTIQNNISLGFLSQIHVDDQKKTLGEYLYEAYVDVIKLQSELESLEKQLTTDHSDALLKKYDRIQTEFLRRGGYNLDTEVNTLITQFGFEVSDLEKDIHEFSGGQITRLAFVRLLLSRPDVLFLDEPTNHLDISTIEWLEGYLKSYEGTIVMISHDRLFLDRICNVIVEIDDRQATRFTGNYTQYVESKEKMVHQHNVKYQIQQKEIKRLEQLIEKFRHKKSKAAFAKSKEKYLDRMDKLEEKKIQSHEFKATFSPKLKGGREVLITDNLTVGYDQPLVSMTQTFLQNKKYAILGDNGTGKSTLLKTIANRLESLGGEMLLGHQIEMGYFDQQLLDFSIGKTVLEEVWDDFPQLDHTQVRTVLGQFLFKGDDVFKSVSVLSGGERVRLSLVKLMLRRDNLLILDEPTNHLDILGKEALEKALKDYTGTLIFVSHDRYFIEKLATDILVIQDHKVIHTEKTLETVLETQKQSESVEKQTRKETYQEFKKNQNRAQKVEGLLIDLEEQLELHRELRYDPEYYHSNDKMEALNEEIDKIHVEIGQLERELESLYEFLEEVDSINTENQSTF